MALYLDDKSGVRFYSDGRAVIDGTTVNVGNPQKVSVNGYTVDAFLSDAPERKNSEYNRIGYCLVPKLGGGEVLYPLLEKTNATDSKTFSRNSGIKLQSYYFIRGTSGDICAIQGKSDNKSLISTQSGEKAPVKDYYFYFDGKAESIKNRGTWFSTWKLNPIEETKTEPTQPEQSGNDEKTYDGGQLNPGVTVKGEAPERIKALQRALNAAGYTDNEGKQLVDDGITGPRTKAVCQKAGVDYRTWKVGDPIKPAANTGQTPGQTQGQTQGQAPDQTPGQTQGQTQGQTTGQAQGQTPGQTPGQTQGQQTSPTPEDYMNIGAARYGADQAKAALYQKIDAMRKSSGRRDVETATRLKACVDSGDYYGALKLLGQIRNVGWRRDINQLLNASREAFTKHQDLNNKFNSNGAQTTQKDATPEDYMNMGAARYGAEQSRSELYKQLDTMAKSSGKNDRALIAQIKSCVESGDYYGALNALNSISNVGWKPSLKKLLDASQVAHTNHQNATKGFNMPQQMNESSLVDALTDMILNEGKKKPNKAVMNESKLVDMIAESMIKNGVIAL